MLLDGWITVGGRFGGAPGAQPSIWRSIRLVQGRERDLWVLQVMLGVTERTRGRIQVRWAAGWSVQNFSAEMSPVSDETWRAVNVKVTVIL